MRTTCAHSYLFAHTYIYDSFYIVQPFNDALTNVTHVAANIAAGLEVGTGNTGSRRRWTTADLEPAIARRFTQAFIPLTRATMSTLMPWHALTVEERQALYVRVFPGHAHIITTNDVVYSLVRVHAVLSVRRHAHTITNDTAYSQMNYRITEWQGKFAAAGLVALEAHFSNAGIAGPKARAAFCREQLGSNVAAMKAPFMWGVWADGHKSVSFTACVPYLCRLF